MSTQQPVVKLGENPRLLNCRLLGHTTGGATRSRHQLPWQLASTQRPLWNTGLLPPSSNPAGFEQTLRYRLTPHRRRGATTAVSRSRGFLKSPRPSRQTQEPDSVPSLPPAPLTIDGSVSPPCAPCSYCPWAAGCKIQDTVGIGRQIPTRPCPLGSMSCPSGPGRGLPVGTPALASFLFPDSPARSPSEPSAVTSQINHLTQISVSRSFLGTPAHGTLHAR